VFDFVNALRLHRPGHVQVSGVNWTRSAGSGRTIGLPYDMPFPRDAPYVLPSGEVESVKALLGKLRAVQEEAFRFSVRRLHWSYYRGEDVDRLVDFWVALEALFVPDGPGDIRYKASMRIAQFIGEPAQRPLIAGEVRKSYKARSGVVHGRPVKNLGWVVAATEWILREALNRWLDQAPSKKSEEVVREIDRSILDHREPSRTGPDSTD
jgi:hypothetical protein